MSTHHSGSARAAQQGRGSVPWRGLGLVVVLIAGLGGGGYLAYTQVASQAEAPPPAEAVTAPEVAAPEVAATPPVQPESVMEPVAETLVVEPEPEAAPEPAPEPVEAAEAAEAAEASEETDAAFFGIDIPD